MRMILLLVALAGCTHQPKLPDYADYAHRAVWGDWEVKYDEKVGDGKNGWTRHVKCRYSQPMDGLVFSQCVEDHERYNTVP